MKIHYLQHVPFEDLGIMASILKNNGHTLTCTKFYEPHALPSVHEFDALMIMGGPMGVNDDVSFSWLRHERQLIEAAVRQKKIILGICLGAQLIAQVLGAKVYPGKYREIGWFEIETCQGINNTLLADIFPRRSTVFHWHGDTFEIPEGADHIARSEACENQGFILENHIAGFQFHLESTPQTVKNLLLNCRDELDGSPYVQDETQIQSTPERFANINEIMNGVLGALMPARP